MHSNEVVKSDVGLGTTFERCVLNQYLLRLYEEKEIRTLLEGPDDGIAGIVGINSLILGIQGTDVTLVLPDEMCANFAKFVWSIYAPKNQPDFIISTNSDLPIHERQFDLVWNFNVMTRMADTQTMLSQMRGLSKKYILFFVPNSSNYSFFLHRLHHKVTKQEWDHGTIGLMRPESWQDMLNNLGLNICETVWLDCPWWPDIVDFGQLISDFFPFLKRLAIHARPDNRYQWTADELPYYDIARYPEVHQTIARLSYFENSNLPWLKKRFAHHVGILAEKIQSS
jgi:hypothetical protein